MPDHTPITPPPRPTGCRMRQATWNAAFQAKAMMADGIDRVTALDVCGISDRSLQRFLREVEGGPRRVTDAHQGAPVPKCLPLFQTDPDVLQRLENVEASAEWLRAQIKTLSDRISTAAAVLSRQLQP